MGTVPFSRGYTVTWFGLFGSSPSVLIAAGRWQCNFAGGKAVYTFAPYSFSILRWENHSK